MENLIPSLKKSIFDSNTDLVIDLAEINMDNILDYSKNDILKDIPIVKTLYSIGKTTYSIYNRYLLKKTLVFLKEFKDGHISQETLIAYKTTLENNPQRCEEELGRVLVYLNNYTDEEKSKWLARVYISYLNKRITNEQFLEYSEIINRLFVQDISILKKIYTNEITRNSNIVESYKLDRLASLGLIRNWQEGVLLVEETPEDMMENYGKIFTRIILNI